MADAEDKIKALGLIFTVGSAGLAAVRNTYFSGGISSWFGGGEIQPINPGLADTNLDPIPGEIVPNQAQGFSSLNPNQLPTEPFASFGPGGRSGGIIDEVLKGGVPEVPPLEPLGSDPLGQPPSGAFNVSNNASTVLPQPTFVSPNETLFPLQPSGPQLLPPDLRGGLPSANITNVNISGVNVSNPYDLPVLNITNTTPTNVTPPSSDFPVEPQQGWLEMVGSYDYSSALTNPYNYLTAMTTYFTLSNIKAAYDNTGISGAVKQSVKEVAKRAVSVYAAEAISEGVAAYLNPQDPIQKEATKQNVKDVIAVTVGVVMPLVSFGMSKYQAKKNEAGRARQEKLAIEYATSLFRADGDVDLKTIGVPKGLDLAVAGAMLQHEQMQRTFTEDFSKTLSKMPDINFSKVKQHIPEGMEFERAMLIFSFEKEKRKKIEVKPKEVIKEAADLTPPPTTYTPSTNVTSAPMKDNPEPTEWQRAFQA